MKAGDRVACRISNARLGFAVAEATPVFAEEIVDLRTIIEMFQGEETAVVTGRVVLHGTLPGARAAICGRDLAELTPIEQPWDDGYLTHLPRCGGCAAPGGEPSGGEPVGGGGEDPPPGRPATGVDVRPAHGSERENAGAEALRSVLAEYDLRRWMFTDLVNVDETIRGGFSHPLTINPDSLVRRPACALTTFLHEQLHWLAEPPGVDAATIEVSKRWPDPPPLPAGGHDAESSWMHLSVCALEYASLCEVLGVDAATAELRQHKIYGWMYERILAEPEWFADLLDRHELRLPSEVPVPRRYYGDEWWKNLV
jgi:hypothetical protein